MEHGGASLHLHSAPLWVLTVELSSRGAEFKEKKLSLYQAALRKKNLKCGSDSTLLREDTKIQVKQFLLREEIQGELRLFLLKKMVYLPLCV